MGGMGWRGMNPFDSVRYSVIWFPNVPVQGQATDLQMVGENLSFTHPLWKDSLNALSHYRRRPKRAFRDRCHPPGHRPTIALGALGRQPWPALQSATG